MFNPLHPFVFTFQVLLLSTPNDSPWSALGIWAVRFITFSLLFRTYIGPWILALLSKHIRVRSISLRSIRGLYIRTGNRTIRVERIRLSYRWSSVEGSSRLTLHIESLNLDFGKTEPKVVVPHRHHNRTLTLADFAPSPMAYRLWSLISKIYVTLDPFFRPVLRTCVVAFLRRIIHWLPAITQALNFDLYTAVITFADLPGTQITIEEARLHTALGFTQLEKLIPTTEDLHPRAKRASRFYNMRTWRTRMTASFGRSWDRAWGATKGTATISLTLKNVSGTTSPVVGDSVKFLGLPGVIDIGASMKFNPKRGIIDSHSLNTTLNIGGIYVAVDAVKALLDLLKKSEPPRPSKAQRPNLFISPFLHESHPMTRSPISLISPTSPMSRHSSSSLSGTSPFFEAISASMRPRPRYRRSRLKLEDEKSTSSLSVLASASIRIANIRMTSGSGLDSDHTSETYEALVHDLQISASLSDPSQNSFHRQLLGRSTTKTNADTYAFSLSMDSTTVERNASRDDLRLLTLGSLEFHILTSQWPSPWLVPTTFLSGDPDAALLAIRITLAGVEVTERLDYLKQWINRARPKGPASATTFPSSPIFPTTLYNIPRLALDVTCGPICGRIICDDASPAEIPLSIELRTNGFGISAASHFITTTFSAKGNDPMVDYNPDYLPLQMTSNLSMFLNPTFVRVRFNGTAKYLGVQLPLGIADPDFLEDPALLSMESLDITGEVTTMGSIHSMENFVSLDTSTTVVDLHCCTDALSVELWHANVIAACAKLMILVPKGPKASSHPTPSTPLLDRLPPGLLASFAVPRLVLFMTSPELNPNDDMDLRRGMAFRTGIQVQYCCLSSPHSPHLKKLRERSETRHKLYLPEERVMEAVAAARSSHVTHMKSAIFGITVSDLALRSAIATQYVVDDPFIAEEDNPTLSPRECLRIARMEAKVIFSGKSSSRDDHKCEVSMRIPYLQGSFQLAHVYSILLAFRTLSSLLEARPNHDDVPLPRPPPPQSSPVPGNMFYRFQANIDTIQILWTLPKEKLALRIDSINAHSSTNGPIGLGLARAVLWTHLPPQTNPWNGNTDDRWEELVILRQCDVFLPLSTEGPLPIFLEIDSGRLRIPFGYVLADLLLDAGITFKALRHLFRMVAAGRYIDIPTPAAEEAKSMPNLTARIRCLCVEAADGPLESRLGLIWRAGSEAAKHRLEREEAFATKVATILAAHGQDSDASAEPRQPHLDSDYTFTSVHTISIEDARRRLDKLHAMDWNARHRMFNERRTKAEEAHLQHLRGAYFSSGSRDIPNIVKVTPTERIPPLCRMVINYVSLSATPPSFPLESLPDFLYEQGGGLPKDTLFSLLVPLHLEFSLMSLEITLRDYPLPLVNIPSNANNNSPGLEFIADLVIAEEMGTDLSVDWIHCPIVEPHDGIHGAAPLFLSVPKTIMPVKSYANPVIRVLSSGVTTFSWGVSYSAATQDMMKVIETLSSSPRDSSPALGFWDKMRLIFHWTILATFKSEVRLHMKGSRDPYNILDDGAGLLLSWQGNPKLLIGHENEDKELVQVISNSMFIAIPNLETMVSEGGLTVAHGTTGATPDFRKVCAKLRSGVRFGVGVVLERSCGPECHDCSGSAFKRKCRFFNFRPHYEIMLERKDGIPQLMSPQDSFNGFRSDFIHLSNSLTSSIRVNKPGSSLEPSSLHLTPKAFAVFWSWWALFDGVLSLPIRQGSFYPLRSLSPKFGRHLATLKYRIQVPRLFIQHVYIDDSRETWRDGVTPFVGIKAMIDEFQVDMHQRDQESIITSFDQASPKVIRHKPFYAAEVVLKGLDLRALMATFEEPLKTSVLMDLPESDSNYRTRNRPPDVDYSSVWFDADDFVEVDWSPSSDPKVHLLPIVACPRFTYFKRNSAKTQNQDESSKFGIENTHSCLLGKEPSVPQVQIALASARVAELRKEVRDTEASGKTTGPSHPIERMIALLGDYVTYLDDTDKNTNHADNETAQNYYMPSDTVSPDEWAEFDSVYQVHCPKIFMDNAIRDIMMQYYYCSRARRGLEYHMATRAVKFIRDQAEAALASYSDERPETSTHSSPQAVALALRRILTGDSATKACVDILEEPLYKVSAAVDPLSGWSNGVSLRKSHFGLLLKPQIVLRSEGSGSADSVLVLAAVQAKLQSFAIMDDANAEDPISGKVMSRNYTSLTGLQSFSPEESTYSGNGCVPLEVLIDFRCESSDFDRLVPQTDATFHYDKFNRLRLRNNVTSVVRARPSQDKSTPSNDSHLQDQTDLVQIHIPRFTVSANDHHFRSISNIVTKLVLFSDVAHTKRMDKVKTMLITYDFTDLKSAADVIADLQGRLRDAMETERTAERNYRVVGDEAKLGLLKLRAHIFLLVDELNLLFDAIKLAQDRYDDRTDQKSALLLHASSKEISWNMLDEHRDLLAKLAVRDINFYRLSQRDNSVLNNLELGNLQAFDGSSTAVWPEILCKNEEPCNHPLFKRGLFGTAHWKVSAPVGGITIYPLFEVTLHPIRLQLDTKVGRRIMEYLWPARRDRPGTIEDASSPMDNVAHPRASEESDHSVISPARSSMDSPWAPHSRKTPHSGRTLLPPLRKLGASRSFTDLRSATSENMTLQKPNLHRARSSDLLNGPLETPPDSPEGRVPRKHGKGDPRNAGDAAEMKTRSSQKSFVLVRLYSTNILLSIKKGDSFECRDVFIKTRELAYRNQTWSFEELVNQFIPSNTSWRGWVKIVFHQSFIPVLPVARELISKTKWNPSSKGTEHQPSVPKLVRGKHENSDVKLLVRRRTRSPSPRRWIKGSKRKPEPPPTSFTALPLTDEPEPLEPEEEPSSSANTRRARSRMLSLFSRTSSRSRKSSEDMATSSSSSSLGLRRSLGGHHED